MSKSLYYKPIQPVKDYCLSTKLQCILTEKYNLEEGTKVLKQSDVNYLKGLFDAGFIELKPLINLLEKGTEIEIYLNQ